MKNFNVGIIGCGLIGQKRSKTLPHNCKLYGVNDLNIKNAKSLASEFEDIKIFDTSKDLIEDKNIDIVIISTLHNSLSNITNLAILNNKHVLVEKPAARNSGELLITLDKLKSSKSIVHVGFNHRYHRAFKKAKEIIQTQALGELMFIRGRYGHGARLGYESEWRANFELSGGGELIDQGPHLIDLAQWLFDKKLYFQSGKVCTYFWDMQVDDNAFLILETKNNQTAFFHVSCTEWKNTFSFEIYGKKGKLEISGLGGSYGVEKLKHYNMLPEMGPPETHIYEYPMADNSWQSEMDDFILEIEGKKEITCGLENAFQVLKIIDKAYGKI